MGILQPVDGMSAAKRAVVSLALLALLVLPAASERISIRAGRQFIITLDSNPTTGYSWQLAKPVNKRLLKHLGNEFISGRSRLIGAGGTEVWKFKALRKGRTDVTLKYSRPWEKDVKPVKIKTYRVTIR